MKRSIFITFAIMAAGLMTQSLLAQTTVTVENSQGQGARYQYRYDTTTGVSTNWMDTTYDKAFVRGKTVTDSTTGLVTDEEWGKVWLQYDLSSVWATYGEDNLTSATLTIWGENGTGRKFDIAGLLDSAGLENWDMNTLNWNNAPAQVVDSGTTIDTSLIYGGAPLWTVDGGGVDLGRPDLGGNYDQCARYSSAGDATATANLTAFLKTDTDGKVTFIDWDYSNSSNQRQYIGTNGFYAQSIIDNSLYSTNTVNGTFGQPILGSPTLTLTFVPEPGVMSLIALGLGGFFFVVRRRK